MQVRPSAGLKALLALLRPFASRKPYPKPYPGDVQVRPSTGLKALLALLRPFASRKAGRKVVAVESLTGIEAATRCGSVASARQALLRNCAAASCLIFVHHSLPTCTATSHKAAAQTLTFFSHRRVEVVLCGATVAWD